MMKPRKPYAFAPDYGKDGEPDEYDDRFDHPPAFEPVEYDDKFEWSRFQPNSDGDDWRYYRTPAWILWICKSSNEVLVLSQFAFSFRAGNKLHTKDGYKWVYKRNKELAKELPCMKPMQIRHAVRQLIKQDILVAGHWKENNRYLRINAATVEKLVAAAETKK